MDKLRNWSEKNALGVAEEKYYWNDMDSVDWQCCRISTEEADSGFTYTRVK
jgi:hypothetical protein